MHQIQIFIGKEDEPARLTKEVNDWLASSNAKVVNIFGNLSPQTVAEKADATRTISDSGGRRYAPSDIMLVVVYQK